NKYITAIKDGMLAYTPFTIIASIFLILACMPFDAFNNAVTAILHCDQAIWTGKLLSVYFVSLNMCGFLVVLTVSYAIAKQLEVNEIQSMVTNVVAFLVLFPLGEGNTIALGDLGATSMFAAIVVSLVGTRIYKAVDDAGIKIKMPDAVPPAVSQPFEALIPSAVVIIVFWVIRLITDATGTTFVAIINSTLGVPLRLLGGTLVGSIISKIFEQLLWFFGIHGGSIVSAAMNPIWQVLEEENRVAAMAGEAIPNIISSSFCTHFMSIGLVGGVIAALIVAKSSQYKEISRMAIGPYAFNVGEPALFGFPLMLNFTIFVPFILSNAVSGIIAYVAMKMGLVAIPTGLVQLPWTMPVIVSGFMVTQSISGAILQIVQLVVATLFWIPFMKKADAEVCALENGSEE
ncbi:MAG: PTS sugar transporter subunit IIC, partial [Firmicutes bacterium]|nr:PTS sugar transporter subunit IIC [Bacillota bacterium]